MAISPVPGIYMILRYSEFSTLPERYASRPITTATREDVPAERPSRPSVRFTPLEQARITTMIIIM